jgi:hypothetical protein
VGMGGWERERRRWKHMDSLYRCVIFLGLAAAVAVVGENKDCCR